MAHFGPIIDRLPARAAAADLWQGVRRVARHPELKEIKRGREGGPKLDDS